MFISALIFIVLLILILLMIAIFFDYSTYKWLEDKHKYLPKVFVTFALLLIGINIIFFVYCNVKILDVNIIKEKPIINVVRLKVFNLKEYSSVNNPSNDKLVFLDGNKVKELSSMKHISQENIVAVDKCDVEPFWFYIYYSGNKYYYRGVYETD